MNKSYLTSFRIFVIAIFFTGCSELSKSVTSPIESFPTYNQDIRSVFERSCVRCHGGEQNGIVVIQKQYDLSTYETAVDSVLNIIPGSKLSWILLKISSNGSMRKYLNSPKEEELIYNWVVSNNAAKE